MEPLPDNLLPVRIRNYVVRLKAAGCAGEVVKESEKRWVFTLQSDTLGEEDSLRILYTRRRNGRMRTEIELYLDGEEVDVKSLTDALIKLGQREGTSGTSAVGGSAPAAANNSVATRRASVIRV